MKVLTLRTTIDRDGTIDLRVASDLPPGEAEVVLVVQSAPARPRATAPTLSGLFAGPERSDEEVIEYIRQLRRQTTEASWELSE